MNPFVALNCGYLNFRNFQPAIEKAKEACAKSGHAVADHFAEMRNMVGIGSGAQREVEDWMLSRYASYLVIQPVAESIKKVESREKKRVKALQKKVVE